MKPKQAPLIQAAELLQLANSPDLILIDATNGKNARENYAQKHLSGALFVDLDTQLADIKADVSNGGRHPLPTLAQFSETLGKLGISPKATWWYTTTKMVPMPLPAFGGCSWPSGILESKFWMVVSRLRSALVFL